MKLSIIIPVYNEEKTILKVIDKVKGVPLTGINKEIIIVDDASQDSTQSILHKIKDISIKIFFHQKNQGKGAAIRTALQHATGDFVLIQDADLEYDPNDYKKLLNPVLEQKAEAVYGSRIFVIKENLAKMYKLHYFGNVFLTFATNLLYGSKITDMETCYKLIKREIILGLKLKSKRFDFEPEITAKLLKRGHKIVEVPITFNRRKFSEGKKITWRDGIKALLYLIKYRFVD